VTRRLLWEEYRVAHPDGSGSIWFCTTFAAQKGRVRPTMRQTHMGGEKVFVDFAGDTIDVFDPLAGEAHAWKLFVAAMGASNYTYAEACASESLPDWIAMHDNLKAAVTNPDRYDPGLNRTRKLAQNLVDPGNIEMFLTRPYNLAALEPVHDASSRSVSVVLRR